MPPCAVIRPGLPHGPMCCCPPTFPGTLGRKEVDEDGDGGNQHAGGDDVDDVEEGLPLDEQVEDHLLVARLLCWCHGVQKHLSWSMPDGPFSILCSEHRGCDLGKCMA